MKEYNPYDDINPKFLYEFDAYVNKGEIESPEFEKYLRTNPGARRATEYFFRKQATAFENLAKDLAKERKEKHKGLLQKIFR